MKTWEEEKAVILEWKMAVAYGSRISWKEYKATREAAELKKGKQS